MADDRGSKFYPLAEDVASTYEDFRTNKKYHPFDRTPGWAYVDAMRHHGINPNNRALAEPVARLTYGTDNRPWLYDKTSDAGHVYRTPSSRAAVNSMRNNLYEQAGYRGAIRPGSMLTGERDAVGKISLRNSMSKFDTFRDLRYKLGLDDPNEYMAYYNRAVEGYTPNPLGYGSVADENKKAAIARNYAILGRTLNEAVPTPLYITGFGLAGRGIQAANVTRKAINTGKPVISRLQALSRYNTMARKLPARTNWQKFRGGLVPAAFGASLGTSIGKAGIDVENSHNQRAKDNGELPVPTNLDSVLFELPVMGYRRGANGPEPIKANYLDYYNHLRVTRGPQVAEDFRKYQREKGYKQTLENRRKLDSDYNAEYDRINNNKYLSPAGRDNRLRGLNYKYSKRFIDSNEALRANDNLQK